jgi:anti-sigma factor RsiW
MSLSERPTQTTPTAGMPSDDQIQLVHAYMDGELDPSDSFAAKHQIDADPRLADEFAQAAAIGQSMRRHVRREHVSEDVRRRVQTIGGRSRWVRSSWMASAAMIVVTVGLSCLTTWFVLRLSSEEYVTSELVDSHVRSLMASTSSDVLSSDRHTVKPWFNGRISQSPRVIDLAEAGFSLAGGRIDVIAKTPVPTLVYKRRDHVISLVAIPTSVSHPVFGTSHGDNGYNMVQWSDGANAFFATSDLNAEELNTFVKLFREAPGG